MNISMLGAVFEFQRDLLIERTKASIVRSRAEGTALDRPSALTKVEQGDAVGHLGAGSLSLRWPDFGTTRQSIMRKQGQTCFSECNRVLTFEQLPSDNDSYRVGIYELNLDRPGP